MRNENILPEEQIGSSLRDFYEEYHRDRKAPWISRRMQHERLKVLRALLASLRVNHAHGEWLIVGSGSGDDVSVIPGAIAIDLSLGALLNTRRAREGACLLQCDAQTMPFRDCRFDGVMCSEVIEHLPERDLFIAEIWRILRPHGCIMLTTPNWRSLYGLARATVERVVGKPITAANQPIDRWTTPKELREELDPLFQILSTRGIWYFPPLGKGHAVIPFPVSALILYPLLPLERTLQRLLPGFGHMLAIVAAKHGN